MKSILKNTIMGMVVISMAMMFGGCGVMMNGSSSMVSFNTVPRANITIDGKKYGQTPVTVKLSNKKAHTFHIESPGYRPYDGKILRNGSAWIVGDILLLFPAGMMIALPTDAISGGMWYLSPKKIDQRLVKETAKSSLLKNLQAGNAAKIATH